VVFGSGEKRGQLKLRVGFTKIVNDAGLPSLRNTRTGIAMEI